MTPGLLFGTVAYVVWLLVKLWVKKPDYFIACSVVAIGFFGGFYIGSLADVYFYMYSPVLCVLWMVVFMLIIPMGSILLGLYCARLYYKREWKRRDEILKEIKIKRPPTEFSLRQFRYRFTPNSTEESKLKIYYSEVGKKMYRDKYGRDFVGDWNYNFKLP